MKFLLRNKEDQLKIVSWEYSLVEKDYFFTVDFPEKETFLA
jgi:hypothetical protein